MLNRREILKYGLLAPMSCVTAQASGRSNGRYFSTPKTAWLSNSDKMQLLEDFRYEDPSSKKWKAPKGSLVDGASIPRFAWSVAGGPFQVPYRDASIIHDYYCDSMKRSWEATHRVFYDAMITSGTSETEALIKYWAVVRGGPRWDKNDRWSGLWPFRYRRADREDKDAAPPPPPPFPTEEGLAEEKSRQDSQARLLAEEFSLIRARVNTGNISPDEVRDIANEQVAIQPCFKRFC